MNWQIKSQFTLAVISIFILLGMVFLNVNAIAKKERTQIQADMIQVQQNIAANLSGDYESGLQLVDQLMIEDDEKIQKIKYDLLDELIRGLDEKVALEKVGTFSSEENGTLNIYSKTDYQLIRSFGMDIFNVSSFDLNAYKENNQAGYYKMISGSLKAGSKESGNDRFYYYVSKSQPWIMVTNIHYKKQPDLTEAAEQVVNNNLNQVSQQMHFQVLEVNSKREIVKATAKELVGRQVLNIKPYGVTNKNADPELFIFNINQADGIQTPWVGSIKETETSSIIIGTPKKVYDIETKQLTFILAFIMLVSFLFGIAIIMLIHRNYLYFLENEQMGGEAL